MKKKNGNGIPNAGERQPGIAVDPFGGPVVDPTQNVLDLVSAAIQRQDDLREMEVAHIRETRVSELDHIRQEMNLRAVHDKELRKAEADRIDAIRAVDVQAVQQANTAAETRATTLAATVVASAEALRAQVATTSSASDSKLTTALEPIQKDIADLRRVQYEGVGQKTQVVESRSGITVITAVVGSGLALLVVLLMIVAVYLTLHHGQSSTPAVTCSAAYHPAPCP